MQPNASETLGQLALVSPGLLLGLKTHEAAYDIGLLLERVRWQVPRGHWLEWLDEEAQIGRRTAQRYIRFRRLVGVRANLAELDSSWSITDAIGHLTPIRAKVAHKLESAGVSHWPTPPHSPPGPTQVARNTVSPQLVRLETLLRQELGSRALRGDRARRVEANRKIGQLLLRAKEALGHGNYLTWLRSLGLTTRTAQRFTHAARYVRPHF